MAFVLPNFNLTANVWRSSTPLTDPPDVITICQLRAPHVYSSMFNGESGGVGSAYMVCPALTDIEDSLSGPSGNDKTEIPAGSGRFYEIIEVDDVAKGFNNEHRYGLLRKFGSWPAPIP